MWISVKDRLPEDERDYLVITHNHYQTVASFQRYGSPAPNMLGWWMLSDAVGGSDADLTGVVTHWSELPEPPAQD